MEGPKGRCPIIVCQCVSLPTASDTGWGQSPLFLVNTGQLNRFDHSGIGLLACEVASLCLTRWSIRNGVARFHATRHGGPIFRAIRRLTHLLDIRTRHHPWSYPIAMLQIFKRVRRLQRRWD